MRIDANSPNFPGPHNWVVWHAERCVFLKCVSWVDDETAQYGEWDSRGIVTRQAKKIAIYFDRHFVVINPIADAQDADQSVEAIAA